MLSKSMTHHKKRNAIHITSIETNTHALEFKYHKPNNDTFTFTFYIISRCMLFFFNISY